MATQNGTEPGMLLVGTVAKGSPETVTLNRQDAVILKWMMHELDERTFVSTSEDRRSIFHIRAKDMRDKLDVALSKEAQDK